MYALLSKTNKQEFLKEVDTEVHKLWAFSLNHWFSWVEFLKQQIRFHGLLNIFLWLENFYSFEKKVINIWILSNLMIKLRINALVTLAAVMCKVYVRSVWSSSAWLVAELTHLWPVGGEPGSVFMLQILIRVSPLEADQGLKQPKPHVLVEFISVVRLA